MAERGRHSEQLWDALRALYGTLHLPYMRNRNLRFGSHLGALETPAADFIYLLSHIVCGIAKMLRIVDPQALGGPAGAAVLPAPLPTCAPT